MEIATELHRGLSLRKSCTETALEFENAPECTENALEIVSRAALNSTWSCTVLPLKIVTGVALELHWSCTEIALEFKNALECHWKSSLEVHWSATGTALELHCDYTGIPRDRH